jgi:RimJ/RimL family protein N-acetyltransferase
MAEIIDLVPFTEDDIDRLIGWIPSEDALLRWTASSFAFPLTREHLRRHLQESAERGDRLIFKAVETASGAACGHIELGGIDQRNRSLRIGRVLLDPAVRGRGLGVAMMRRAVAVAFGQLGMHRVELAVFEVNPQAIACYERAGFRQEGMRRESFLGTGGEFWNDIIMSILSTEETP